MEKYIHTHIHYTLSIILPYSATGKTRKTKGCSKHRKRGQAHTEQEKCFGSVYFEAF